PEIYTLSLHAALPIYNGHHPASDLDAPASRRNEVADRVSEPIDGDHLANHRSISRSTSFGRSTNHGVMTISTEGVERRTRRESRCSRRKHIASVKCRRSKW